jgi:3',5'-cyclic AMP phosphodiesterase CpdA
MKRALWMHSCRLLRIWILIALAAAAKARATDITFFAVSDTHIGNDNADYPANRKLVVDVLNSLPGQQYPAAVGGGTIAKPRGVLVPGDLVDRPDAKLWSDYIADFGVNAEGRLKYPVFDGLGNHDEPGNVRAGIISLFKSRNAARKTIHSDTVNYHYSWDWDQVHFVNLNLYSGGATGTGTGDPYHAVDFLKADLEKYVGKSGRPVFVFQHYQFDNGDSWWNWTEKQKTLDILKNYNVIGLLHGHSHGKKIYKWQGFDVLDDGTAMKADCMVVRITDTRMFAVNKVKEQWGTLVLDKPVTMGTPVGIHPGPAQRGMRQGKAVFAVAGQDQRVEAAGDFSRVLIRDLRGREVRGLALAGGVAIWDRRDEAGRPARAGLYFLSFRGASGDAQAKVVLR